MEVSKEPSGPGHGDLLLVSAVEKVFKRRDVVSLCKPFMGDGNATGAMEAMAIPFASSLLGHSVPDYSNTVSRRQATQRVADIIASHLGIDPFIVTVDQHASFWAIVDKAMPQGLVVI